MWGYGLELALQRGKAPYRDARQEDEVEAADRSIGSRLYDENSDGPTARKQRLIEQLETTADEREEIKRQLQQINCSSWNSI
jgi:hypothetical protein